MSKKVLIIVLILVLSAGAIWLWQSRDKQTSYQTNTNQSNNDQSQNDLSEGGKYKEFKNSDIGLSFFYPAEWGAATIKDDLTRERNPKKIGLFGSFENSDVIFRIYDQGVNGVDSEGLSSSLHYINWCTLENGEIRPVALDSAECYSSTIEDFLNPQIINNKEIESIIFETKINYAYIESTAGSVEAVGLISRLVKNEEDYKTMSLVGKAKNKEGVRKIGQTLSIIN